MLITLTIFSEVEITIKALPLIIGNLFMNMEVYGEGTLVLGLESEMRQCFDDLGHIQYLGAFDHGK